MKNAQQEVQKKVPVPLITEKEWDILKPLWERGSLAARDVYSQVPKENNWSPKTVKTMLARLVRKDVIRYQQIGNSYLYRPVYSQQEMTRAAFHAFIRKVFAGTVNPFLAYFAENASRDELRQLQKELRKFKRDVR